MIDDQIHAQRGEQVGDADEAVAEVIRRMLSDILGVSRDLITPDALLLELGAQSFDFVDLVVRLEKAYDIDIPPLYAVPDRHTVATYVRAVAEGRSNKRGAMRRPDGVGGG